MPSNHLILCHPQLKKINYESDIILIVQFLPPVFLQVREGNGHYSFSSALSGLEALLQTFRRHSHLKTKATSLCEVTAAWWEENEMFSAISCY